MAKHLELGQRGERIAKEFLIRKGYQILATNWRFSRAEIDIIAKEGDILVFVEVKTRSDDYMGPPELFVTRHKEHLLADAATAYMEEIQHLWEIRFDIVAVLYRSRKQIRITHFPDAFFPGW